DLDGKSGAGVQLQQLGATHFIEHNVGTDVTQACHLKTAGSQQQHVTPVGDLNLMERSFGVGMVGNRAGKLHGPERRAGTNVESHPHGALVQVSFAVRGVGSQTQHRHHRVALEHNDADIRYAFVGIAFERIVELDQVFNNDDVRFAAQ